MSNQKENRYRLRDNGEFVISDYNSTKLFSSFFPGVAGKVGIPMWTFYVNRGQCICSMGIEGKDKPIMEFLPANRAYQLTTSQGFRTFIKPLSHESISYYEPFQNHHLSREMKKTQRMIIAPARLTLEEENHTLGLKFTVDYFNVPQDKYAGLIRTLKIQNMNNHAFELEGLDGLPLIVPYGIDNIGLKFIRRLVEAFVEVSNYETGIPFFRGKVEPADRPEVVHIKKGNFYVGFEDAEDGSRMISPIVDPVKIFGSQSDYNYPERFLTDPVQKMYEGQVLENRLPSAMGYFKSSISAGGSFTYNSIIGHSRSIDELNSLLPIITNQDYVETKRSDNKNIIEALTQKNFLSSSESVLNLYTRQNFLDNILRGGFPHTLIGNNSKMTLHLYSRKHGDLERDYNDYRLNPTYYSQGNGNYRDVNQNRRNDLFFNPDVKENNVEQFYDLIQLDGFNPLVIRETRFKVSNEASFRAAALKHLDIKDLDEIKEFTEVAFAPGELLSFIKDNKIHIKNEVEIFISDLLKNCEKIHITEYGESYWTDHWTYNLDLLENYLAIYPEKLHYLLFEKKTFSFYDNPHRVLPRDEKYVIWDGKKMQLNSVAFDEEKEEMINARSENNNRVHTKFGRGKTYKTYLINTFICLIANKMASLDPKGVGIEMEADKPNWYDALNGLPGLFGSSLNETLEVKRHILFLMDAFNRLNLNEKEWLIFDELATLMQTLFDALQAELSLFEFWDKVTTAKESYREMTRFGISGKEVKLSLKKLKDFLSLCLNKIDKGLERAWGKENKVISTYFINEVTDYTEIECETSAGEKVVKLNSKGLHCFQAKKFRQKHLPLFLEGPVHYLRCKPEKEKAKELVKNIRNSALFDKELGMYKVNESLKDQPHEIGRARTFSPGWFENESIWLHMEYKYMLEILRNGLYKEFYCDFKNIFVPFFKPEIYGRSILENSSFIVSSANPDPSIHGNGFVARLSGATAEFIHILLLMTVGPKPFSMKENGELRLNLKPAIPGWLFAKEAQDHRFLIDGKWQKVTFPENSFSFMFLGSIIISYQNPKSADTFGKKAVSPISYEVIDSSGVSTIYKKNVLEGDIVKKIRDRKINRINITLG